MRLGNYVQDEQVALRRVAPTPFINAEKGINMAVQRGMCPLRMNCP
jgi:hypothetical protein